MITTIISFSHQRYPWGIFGGKSLLLSCSFGWTMPEMNKKLSTLYLRVKFATFYNIYFFTRRFGIISWKGMLSLADPFNPNQKKRATLGPFGLYPPLWQWIKVGGENPNEPNLNFSWGNFLEIRVTMCWRRKTQYHDSWYYSYLSRLC